MINLPIYFLIGIIWALWILFHFLPEDLEALLNPKQPKATLDAALFFGVVTCCWPALLPVMGYILIVFSVRILGIVASLVTLFLSGK